MSFTVGGGGTYVLFSSPLHAQDPICSLGFVREEEGCRCHLTFMEKGHVCIPGKTEYEKVDRTRQQEGSVGDD